LNLLNTMLKGDKKIVGKEKAGLGTKCAFLELSRIASDAQAKGEDFVSRVSGVYIITSNRILGDHSVIITKDAFLKNLMRNALGESREAAEKETLRRLWQGHKGVSTDVLCTVGAESEVSFESYQMVGRLPIEKTGGEEGA
jgi:hypothetical protein